MFLFSMMSVTVDQDMQSTMQTIDKESMPPTIRDISIVVMNALYYLVLTGDM